MEQLKIKNAKVKKSELVKYLKFIIAEFSHIKKVQRLFIFYRANNANFLPPRLTIMNENGKNDYNCYKKICYFLLIHLSVLFREEGGGG